MRTRTLVIGMIVALAIGRGIDAAGLYTVNVYDCLRVSSAPKLDGRLDDACWRALPAMDVFYKYRGFPIDRIVVSPMKTVARVGWDDTALYLAIALHDDVAKLKARVGGRDDADIWRDDCVEIYVDPDASGRFFYKLSTNSIGTRLDFTGPIRDSSWNPPWRVACAVHADHWTVEASVPWGAFRRRPAPGEFWAFDLVRFSHTSGRLRGANWTPKAAQGHSGLYGYLHFGRVFVSDLKHLVRTAGATRGGAWQMPVPGGVLTYADHRAVLRAALRDAAQAMGLLDAMVRLAPAPGPTKPLTTAHAKLTADLRRLQREADEATTDVQRQALADPLRRLSRQARALHWQIAEQQLVRQVTR